METADLKMEDARIRFSDLFTLDDVTAIIYGCGSIGSYTAASLVRSGVKSICLIDHDTVAIENIGVQHYSISDIGKPKVKALKEQLKNIDPFVEIADLNRKVDGSYVDTRNPGGRHVHILAFDNMKSRRRVAGSLWNENGKYAKERYLIDARMGSQTAQVYPFDLSIDSLEHYFNRWYSDEDGSNEPCNARSTSYSVMMIAALICAQMIKMLNKSVISDETVFDFPSMTIEVQPNLRYLTSK